MNQKILNTQNALYNGWGELMFYRMNNPNIGNPNNNLNPTPDNNENNPMNGKVNDNPNDPMLCNMMNGSKYMSIPVSNTNN